MNSLTIFAVMVVALLGNARADYYFYYPLEDEIGDYGLQYQDGLTRVRRESEGAVTGGVNASPGGGAAVSLGAGKQWTDGSTTSGVAGTYKGTFGEGKPQHDLGLMAGRKWSGGEASFASNIPLGSNRGPASLGGNVGGTVWNRGSSSVDLNAGYMGQVGQGKPQHSFSLGATHTSPGSQLGATGTYLPGGRGTASVDYSRQVWKGSGGRSFDVTSSYQGAYGGGRPNHGVFFGGRLNY